MRPDFTTMTGLTRAAARRRHEFAGVLDRFDIEQNGSRLVVQCEVVKEIGDIDVELVANGHDSGKSHAALRRPVHHAGGNGTRLRDQGQISRNRHVRGEACVEACPRHHDAEAIGPDEPYSVSVRSTFDRVRERTGAVAKPRGNNDGTRRPIFSGFIDDAWNCRRRRGDDDEFGHKRQFRQAADRRHAVDFGMMRIHQCEVAFESGLANVSKYGPPDRAPPRTRSHERNRMRRQQIG
jgi:hypothetical protein